MLFKLKFIIIILLIGFFSLIASPVILNAAYTFSIDDASKKITISNDKLQLKFLDSESGFGLFGIINKRTGHSFLNEASRQKNLWKIKLKDAYNQFLVIDNTIDCNKFYTIEKSSDGKNTHLHLFWDNIKIGEETNALTVKVSIRLEELGMSYWNIQVKNNSEKFGQRGKGYGVWEVIFPTVRGIKAASNDSIHLASPRYLGQLIKNPVERMPLKMYYPSYRSKMQFSTLFKSDSSNGLYLGTFDPKAYTKKFLYDLDEKGATIKWEIIHYPVGMGQSANGYEMSYEVGIGVFEGDWITASKIYRNWAINQFWCSKGKLSQRNDIPKWLLNTVLWFSGMTTDKMVPIAKYLAVPIAYQWYNWHEIEFDSYYPDYFPAKNGFKNKVKELQKAGIKIVPYINARLWEKNSPSWKEENPYSATTKAPYQVLDGLSIHNWGTANKNLVTYSEHWNGYNHAVMCPTSEIWQNKQTAIIDRLISKIHVNGVYLDQIASFYPVLCFDPDHGHSIGGGNYWVTGYRDLIEKAKKESRKIDKGAILTSEGHDETYLDLFDSNLACNSASIAPELIPMFHYVYSGYALTFGRATGRWHTEWYGDEYTTGLPLIMRNVQMFIWGEQLGWFSPNVLELPGPDAEYIKTLCQALSKDSLKKFLFFGEMLRPLIIEGDNPMLSAKWSSTQKVTEMPAVMHSVWKAEDGTVGLIFTNMDNYAHTINYTIDINNYQLPHTNRYIVETSGTNQISQYNSNIISRTENMPPRSILVLDITADKK